jgi:spore germination protein (amino acid permease)
MDKLSSKHFIFLILGTAIVSLKTYPETFIKNGGRDSWIAVIISSGIIFGFFLYMINMWKKSGEHGLVEIYQKGLGKILGNIALFLFIATLFITLIECSSVETDSMHQNMLIETPKWFYLIFFIVPSIYTIHKEIVAVVTVTIIGIILIMLAGVNLAILTAPYKQFSALLPIFENGITGGFFICILKTLGLYGCVSITLPYLSKIKDEKKKFIKNTSIGLIILIQMEIVSISGLIMTFEPGFVNTLNYPKLIQTQLVSYMQFLEFGELYVMLQILGGWLLKYLLTFYALLMILRELNIKRKYVIYLTYIISVLVFTVSYFTVYDMFKLFKLLNYYEYICLVNYIVIPLIVFMMFNRKMKKTAKQQQ